MFFSSPVIKVILGTICISFAPVFVKLVQATPTLIAWYRCAIASVLIFPFLFKQKNKSQFPKAAWIPAWIPMILAALAFAIDLTAWHRSVIYIGAGMGTILANTQVFYITLLSALLFKERLTLKFLFICILAFIGITLLVQSNNDTSTNHYLGVGLGLFTGLMYSIYILCIHYVNKKAPQLSIAHRIFYISLFTTLIISFFCLYEKSFALVPLKDFGFLFLLGLIPQTIGWYLLTQNLPKISVALGGLLLLGQPSLATIWGIVLFAEPFTFIQIIGFCLTLGAIYWGSLIRKKSV